MLPVSFITSWAAPTNSLHSCPSTRHSSREILPSPRRNIKGFLDLKGAHAPMIFRKKTGVVPRLGIYMVFRAPIMGIRVSWRNTLAPGQGRKAGNGCPWFSKLLD